MGEEYTVNVPPELASRARRVASQTDRRPEEVLSEWLTYVPIPPQAKALSHKEAELLQKINIGLSETQWQRYHSLIAKRRSESLTQDELVELISLSDQVEQANARRIANLIELARLRNSTLERVMQELGIHPSDHV
jgi:hypothetical protein